MIKVMGRLWSCWRIRFQRSDLYRGKGISCWPLTSQSQLGGGHFDQMESRSDGLTWQMENSLTDQYLSAASSVVSSDGSSTPSITLHPLTPPPTASTPPHHHLNPTPQDASSTLWNRKRLVILNRSRRVELYQYCDCSVPVGQRRPTVSPAEQDSDEEEAVMLHSVLYYRLKQWWRGGTDTALWYSHRGRAEEAVQTESEQNTETHSSQYVRWSHTHTLVAHTHW